MSSNPDVPPFTGYVETTVNALRLIHAARQGIIPRITRRLNDTERRTMIKSGAVFVFSVEESGIKRWTDGLLWSPSRIVGNFLVYREINERPSGRSIIKKTHPGDEPSRLLAARRDFPERTSIGHKPHLGTGHAVSDKPNGLIKKTITVNVEGSDLHLISYYTLEDIRSGKLKRPSSRPDIMSPYMPPHLFRLTAFRVPPKVEAGPDGKPRLVWSMSLDEARTMSGTLPRQELTWSPSPSPTHNNSHPVSRRRDSNGVLQTHSYHIPNPSSRWQGNSYEAVSTSTAGIYSDRGHSPAYESASTAQHHPRDSEPLSPTYSGRYANSRLNYDYAKPGREAPHSGSSFTGSATPLSFTSHGYSSTHHYGSVYDSGLIDAPSLHSLTQPAMRNYDTQYSATSGALTSQDGYGSADSYRDS
ncbi:hypothetical protein BDN72DRAFT_854934 [Pluteus cervinus]|uniref:Uncharacterized protein n=1 Tax=Pluteus cervinus TaxID=181527 RepID=A0ACD3B5M2_9AGAR|nr:hypothetical protein BDN72DRAFT_854934 [Pluteus cervinus]